MSRIAQAFSEMRKEGRKGLIPFITAGDPDLETTRELLIEFGRVGAAAIELGVPFTDPMADGPVIQRASQRALRHGFGMRDVLDMVAQAHRQTNVPIILFSYFNPLFKYGLENLSRDVAAAGIDGVLVTDLIPEESKEFAGMLNAKGLDLIFLAAPTSTDARLKLIAENAQGFIYAVSRAGVTGTRDDISQEAKKLVNRIRMFSDLPVAVGFGISNSAQVAETWEYADAAVVGSAIVAEIEKLQDSNTSLVADIGRFTAALMPTQEERPR